MWLIGTDPDGRQTVEKTYIKPTHDDVTALARYANGDVLVGGSAGAVSRLIRLNSAHTVLFDVAMSAGTSTVRDVAVSGSGVALAGGMLDLNSKTGDAWAGGFDGQGKALWTWQRDIAGRRVAVTRVADAKTAANGLPVGTTALLGHDRLLPASSGPDLYTMWLITLDTSGKVIWHTALTKDITGAASGLVAQADGTFITLIEVVAASTEVQLRRVDAKGKMTPFVTLKIGLGNTTSELLRGPQSELFVVRDKTHGSGMIYRFNAKGATLSQTPLVFPKGSYARVFDAQWAGDLALLLSGDLIRKVSKTSSSTNRAFIRRIDLSAQPTCPVGDACRGDTHGCPTKGPCDLALCSGVTGCTSTPIVSATCGK